MNNNDSKTIPAKDIANSVQLIQLIENGQVQNLKNFLENNSISPQILNDSIYSLLKIYNKDDKIFYDMLNLLLMNGASVNCHIVYQGKKQIKKEEKITLLMFGIINNDINLIKLVLNYNPDIEQMDYMGRTAIIYAIIFDNNDSIDILNLLIKNKANINYSLNLQISHNSIQYHSVLSLACAKDLVNNVKCLLDNNVDTNFRTQPEGDTCLHLAVKNSSPRLIGLLLSCPRVNPEITNNKGKKAVELINSDENKNIISTIFENYYNNYIKKISQNIKQGKNMNFLNFPGNNNIPQINNLNQMQQMNQILLNNNVNVNYGKTINLNNSPNAKFNYNPQGMNIGIQNNKINNNNSNIMNINLGNNNLQNTNISKHYENNDSGEGSLEEEENNNNLLNKNIPLNYINNNNYQKNNINNNINKSMLNKNDSKDLISNSNTNMNIDLQNNIINLNNNINKNAEHVNQSKTNVLKTSLYNKYFNNLNNNFNVEIPVEFKKNRKINNNNNPINMRKFLKQNNTPSIYLDLTKKSRLDLELKILKLNEELKEKGTKILELSTKNKKLDDEIIKNENIKSEKEAELKYYKNLNKQDKKIINELNNNQKELIKKIPQNQIFLNSNKNVSSSEYRNLKFTPPSLEQSYLYKILQKDLIDYQKYINYLISKKIPKIEIIIHKLKLIIEEISPDYEIKVYGSYAHGLSLPWSDLNLILVKTNNKENVKDDNLTITDIETTVGEKSVTNTNDIQCQNDNNSTSQELNKNENNRNNNIKENIDLLLKLYYILEKKNWINKLKINNNENINTILFEVKEDNLIIEINICIESEINNGLKVVELIKSYIKEYPVLKPLVLSLGTILKNANLNVPSSGGLSSYGLILMIVSFIQNQRESINDPYKEYIIGKTFYEFLLHYGIRFDFNKYVILTYKINDTNTSINDKDNQFNLGQNAKELMIMDPLNNKNNVAKSTFQFMNLKMAFMISFMVTNEDCECGCHYGKALYENSFSSIERSYLKRMFNSVKRFGETGK